MSDPLVPPRPTSPPAVPRPHQPGRPSPAPGPSASPTGPRAPAPDGITPTPDRQVPTPDEPDNLGGSRAAGSGELHTPPYRPGPSGGDSHTVVKANRRSGTALVLEHNTRQAAFVHCVGLGPMANFEVHHVVRDPVRSVVVRYDNTDLTDSVVINAIVRGSKSGWLGHGSALGPTTFLADRNGSIDIRLHRRPEEGETLRIQFGLQTHAGCLPYPVLGLPGSRVVEKGKATFTGVSVG